MAIQEERHWRVVVGGDSRKVETLEEAKDLERTLLLAEDLQQIGSWRGSDVWPEEVADWLLKRYHLVPRGADAAKAAKDLSEQLIRDAVVETVRF